MTHFTYYNRLWRTDTLLILPDWLSGISGLRTWETRTDGSSLPSSDCCCLDRTRWTATVALRATKRWNELTPGWLMIFFLLLFYSFLWGELIFSSYLFGLVLCLKHRGLLEHYLCLPGQSWDDGFSVAVSIYPETVPSFFVDWTCKEKHHKQCSNQ